MPAPLSPPTAPLQPHLGGGHHRHGRARGPIVLYHKLRLAGAGIYPALLVGGLPAALSATVKLARQRRVDGLAVAVLTMLVASAGVSLLGGSPRFLLAKDGMLTAATGVWFFISLRAKRPLTFRFTRPKRRRANHGMRSGSTASASVIYGG